MRRSIALAAAFAGLAAGCGGASYTFAPVTGKVTLNGQPLAKASVEFQPQPAGKGTDAGPGSMGVTDTDGKFVLKNQLDPSKAGAVVGKHTVRIYIYTEHTPGEDRDADSGGPKKKAAGPVIPTRYNSATTLSVDVPAGGLADYHFDLKSP